MYGQESADDQEQDVFVFLLLTTSLEHDCGQHLV